MIQVVDKKAQGKRNRALGSDTERRVRKDLEDKNWIVDKWSNNVNLEENRLFKVKNKFRGIGIPMMLGAGFPDFVAFRLSGNFYEVIGVEVKSNGYLDKGEQEKCVWLLKNKVFSKILIASRDKINNRIHLKYKEFVEVENG